MNLKDIFVRLGFPKHSEEVYQELSNTKESLPISLLAKNIKLPRMTVYRCLGELIKNDLVEKIPVGKRFFYAVGQPRQLKKLMQFTEANSDQILEKYTKKQAKDVPRSVQFFYGANGIKAAFDDVVAHTKKGDTFFRYTSERDLTKVNQYLARDYRLKRDKKKLERLVISNVASGRQKKSRLERFIKFIPPDADQFEQNVIQLIYGDRMSLIDLNKEEVMIIESKQLAEFQKVIFKLLYRRLDR